MITATPSHLLRNNFLLVLLVGVFQIGTAQYNLDREIDGLSDRFDDITNGLGFVHLNNGVLIPTVRGELLADGDNQNSSTYFFLYRNDSIFESWAPRDKDYLSIKAITVDGENVILANWYTIVDGRGQDILGHDISCHNTDGGVLWSLDLGYGGGFGAAHDITILPYTDTSFTVVRYSTYQPDTIGAQDIRVLEVSSTGNILSDQIFGSTNIDTYESVGVNPDGNLVIIGESFLGDGDNDLQGYKPGQYWYWEIDRGKNTILRNKYFDTNENHPFAPLPGHSNAEEIIFDNSGNPLLFGRIFWIDYKPEFMIQEDRYVADACILKLNLTTNILEYKAFGGSNGDFFRGCSSTEQGELVCWGDSWSSDGDLEGNDPTLGDGWIATISDFQITNSFLKTADPSPSNTESYIDGFVNESSKLVLLYSNEYRNPEIHIFSKSANGYVFDKKLGGNVNVYPNPVAASGVVFIEPNSYSTIKSVSLVSAQGRSVALNSEVQINQFSLPSDVKPGVYLLKIMDQTGKVSQQKLLIE